MRAYVCWLGCVAFTAYNYAIYAFSIHFGPLFLPWIAVLGLTFYALIGSLATVHSQVVKRHFTGRAMPLTAWTLIVLALFFLLLWLSEMANARGHDPGWAVLLPISIALSTTMIVLWRTLRGPSRSSITCVG